MRKMIAAAAVVLGSSLVGAPTALAVSPQPSPPSELSEQVSAVLYRILPPNPCVRIPSLGLSGIVPCIVPGR